MKKNKKQKKVMFLLLLLLAVTVGFALLSTTLKINGVTGIKSNRWDVHWENVVPNPESTVQAPTPVIDDTDGTSVSYSVELELPGDYYEFTIDARNSGTIAGKISDIVHTVYEEDGVTKTTLPEYIKYSIVYDGTDVAPVKDDIINVGEKKTYRVRIEYDSEAKVIPNGATSYKITEDFDYIQTKTSSTSASEEEICIEPVSFENDSWETIGCNVRAGNTSKYNVGDEKNVEISTMGTYKVRVVNNSIPAECTTTGIYSQSACGFVVEFVDNISNHSMRNTENYNNSGWKVSDMRDYVNNDIYNLLPNDLKEQIITTPIISGTGYHDSIRYVSTVDKLYLLDAKELWGNDSDMMNVAKIYNRQMDYYQLKEVSNTNTTFAIKKYNNANNKWWLRTQTPGVFFYFVESNGTDTNTSIYATISAGGYTDLSNADQYGVSPVFRIGKDWKLTNKNATLKEQKMEYYLNNNTKLMDGWYELKDNQYYFFEDGYMKTGWHIESNNKYYLSEKDEDSNGYVDGNRVSGTTMNIDGVDYTFDASGICTNCN